MDVATTWHGDLPLPDELIKLCSGTDELDPEETPTQCASEVVTLPECEPTAPLTSEPPEDVPPGVLNDSKRTTTLRRYRKKGVLLELNHNNASEKSAQDLPDTNNIVDKASVGRSGMSVFRRVHASRFEGIVSRVAERSSLEASTSESLSSSAVPMLLAPHNTAEQRKRSPVPHLLTPASKRRASQGERSAHDVAQDSNEITDSQGLLDGVRVIPLAQNGREACVQNHHSSSHATTTHHAGQQEDSTDIPMLRGESSATSPTRASPDANELGQLLVNLLRCNASGAPDTPGRPESQPHSSYYAVTRGRQTGIFTRWDEASKSVLGLSYAIVKKCTTLESAIEFSGMPNPPVRDKYTGPGLPPSLAQGETCLDVDRLTAALNKIVVAGSNV